MGLKRIAAGLVAGGVAVFAGTASTEDKTERGDNGEIVESGGLGVFKVRIGDCVQLPDEDAALFESLEGVPCAQPHDAQAYAEFDLAGSSYSEAAVEQAAEAGCLDRFGAAIGRSYDDAQELDFFTLYPSPESWEAMEDRAVSCLVISVDGSPRSGSDVVS